MSATPNTFGRTGAARLRNSKALLVLGATLLVPALLYETDSFVMETAGLTALIISFAIAVAWASNQDRIAGAFGDIVAEIGRYSYSIYLWHIFLSPLFVPYRVTFLTFWAYVAGSILLGAATAHILEFPSLALRERWVPARRTESSLTASPSSGVAPVPERWSVSA